MLALWCKESAALFVLLSMWTDLCVGEKSSWPFRRYGLYVIVMGLWLALRGMVVGDRTLSTPTLDNPLVDASLVERIVTAGAVQFDYFRLQLWPTTLSSDYSFNQIPVVTSWLDHRFLLFLAIVVAAVVISWMQRRDHPVVALSVGGYTILFSATSNFLFPIGTIMAERLAYAPSVFFCLLLGYEMWEFYLCKRRPAAVLFLLVLVFYGWITVDRNRSWANTEVFNQTQVNTAPGSAKAQYGVGRDYALGGEFDRAIVHLRQSVEIFPEYTDAWNTLGTVYTEQEALHTAIETFQEAISRGAADTGLHFNLGRAYQLLGEYPLAVQSFQTAIQMDRAFTKAYINLGGVYYQTGRYSEAGEIWETALRLAPDNQTVRENLDILRREVR